MLQYQQLAFRTGKELHPSSLKDLKFPVEIGLATEDGISAPGRSSISPTTRSTAPRARSASAACSKTRRSISRRDCSSACGFPSATPHQALLVAERAVVHRPAAEDTSRCNKDERGGAPPRHAGPTAEDGMRVIESGLQARRPGDRQRIAAARLADGAAEAPLRKRRCGTHPSPPAHCVSTPARQRPTRRLAAMFSRFFIDRPILASVPSIIITLAGLAAVFSCRWRSIPRSRRRRSRSPATIPAPAPGGGRHRGRADRAAGQRRGGHALHVVAVRATTAATS